MLRFDVTSTKGGETLTTQCDTKEEADKFARELAETADDRTATIQGVDGVAEPHLGAGADYYVQDGICWRRTGNDPEVVRAATPVAPVASWPFGGQG